MKRILSLVLATCYRIDCETPWKGVRSVVTSAVSVLPVSDCRQCIPGESDGREQLSQRRQVAKRVPRPEQDIAAIGWKSLQVSLECASSLCGSVQTILKTKVPKLRDRDSRCIPPGFSVSATLSLTPSATHHDTLSTRISRPHHLHDCIDFTVTRRYNVYKLALSHRTVALARTCEACLPRSRSRSHVRLQHTVTSNHHANHPSVHRHHQDHVDAKFHQGHSGT